MISINTKQAYTELDNFIELLDDYHKNKVPQKLRDYFKNKKDNNYIKNIDPNIPIKEQNLKRETLALIAMLNLKYWCEDEEEKERLLKIYENNEKRHQEIMREKYNPDKLFKNKIIKNAENSTEMVEYKEPILKNIINKLKRIFKKK